jgi:membrane protein YdbS with pleckstrin-like domain
MLNRPRRDRVLTAAMALFAVGLLALAVAFVLFAVGHRELPVWLSAASMLLPIGFAIGAVRTVHQWRRRGLDQGGDQQPQ